MSTPFFILATGQSNMEIDYLPLTWAANPRVLQWNNTQTSDQSVGNAYAPISSQVVGVAQSYASRVAAADINKDVYLLKHARGGLDITHWIGGAFYQINQQAPGGIVLNAAPTVTTSIWLSEKDVFNISRPYSLAMLVPNEHITINQGTSYYKYRINGAPVVNANGATIPVVYVGGSGNITSGAVQVALQPQFLEIINTTVPIALAAAGASTVDVVLWWQGESDAGYNSRYTLEFNAVMNWMATKPWWGTNTKVVICGLNSNANSGMAAMDSMNATLQGLASGSSNRYFANSAAALPANRWQSAHTSPPNFDPFHMTALGYKEVGDFIFNSVYAPPLVPAPPTISPLAVRNQTNTGWLNVQPNNIHIRNNTNNGWIAVTENSFKIRDSSNSYWINPFSSGGSSPISAISATTPIEVMDVTTNAAHQTLDGSTAYGLWIDGSTHPYRDGTGNIYISLPHSENYRFKIGNFSNGSSWQLEGPTLVGARNTAESAYNNRNWLFGVWSEGNNIAALVHHEWYVDSRTVAGVAGFNNANYTGNFNRRWVNGIGWAQSTNGGQTFSTSPAANSSRLVLVPEPFDVQSPSHMYGFFHPSNIVKEGMYYYAAVEIREHTPSNGFDANGGVGLIRTLNVNSPTGWEYWSGSVWVTVNHNSYQGNLSPQKPFRFFAQNNHNYYASAGYNSHMGQSLRKHTPSGQWIMFGFSGTTSSVFAYSTSQTLANPTFTTIHPISNPSPGDFNSSGGKYMSVFDESATDNNFVEIGNNPTVLVTSDFSKIKRGTLTIT